MLRPIATAVSFGLCAGAALAQEAPTTAPADAWPGFRGVGSSVSDATDLPTTWSAESDGAGIAWTAKLTGVGQSSPVVHDGRVWVTSIRGAQKQHCVVACFELESGTLLWQRTFPATSTVELSGMVSQAAPTPVVGPRGIYAVFESGDIFALSHDGELLWTRALVPEFGPFEGNHGIGSSPLLVGEHLVYLADHAGPSYLAAFDVVTGELNWKLDREPRVSWATPAAVQQDDSVEIVVSSNGDVTGVAAADGSVRWVVEDVTGNTVPSPTALGSHVLIAASKGVGARLLRRPGGDDAAEILWAVENARPSGFGSPLVFDGRVYLLNKSGSLFVIDLTSGEVVGEAKLTGGAWASPVAADGHLWFFGDDGRTSVLRPTAEGVETVATNEVEPSGKVVGVAVVTGSIVVRETDRLVCFRNGAAPDPKAHESTTAR